MNRTKIILAVTALCVTASFLLFSGVVADPKKVGNSEILTTKDGWQDVYDKFHPDEGLVESIAAKTGEDLTIEVYLAFWCGDSKKNIPPFYKIVEKINALAKTPLKVQYYSVERKPSKDIKYFVEKLKVERVPTFIFYREGKEIGRIIENPKKNMLEDILEILF